MTIDKQGRVSQQALQAAYGVVEHPCPKEHWPEWEKCKTDPVYWIEKYCRTFDPRRADGDRWVSFVLWDRQKEYVRWLQENYKNKRPCVVLKCRTVGASWLTLCFFLHIWLFERDAKLSLGSRKEEFVDSAGQMDALFPKVRSLIEGLPDWMRPEGLDKSVLDLRMKLRNPQTGSMMTGEAGQNMGTGGRSTAYMIDEFAKVDFSTEVQGSVQDNSDFIVYISTPRGLNNEFARMIKAGHHPVFRFTYKDDPNRNFWFVGEWKVEEGKCSYWNVTNSGNGYTELKDAVYPWYEEQKLVRDPLNLAMEVDADLYGSMENAVFPTEWIDAVFSINLKQEGCVLAGLDLGESEVRANTVLTVRQGPVCIGQHATSGSSVEGKMFSLLLECEKARVGGRTIEQVVYDAAGGSGASFSSEIKGRKFNFTLIPLMGQAPASKRMWPDHLRSDEKFQNARAEAYGLVRERFRKTYEKHLGLKDWPDHECCCAKRTEKLYNQLAQIQWAPSETGKMKVMSKEKMKAEGQDSPNEADSFVYAFAFEKHQTITNHRYGKQEETQRGRYGNRR